LIKKIRLLPKRFLAPTAELEKQPGEGDVPGSEEELGSTKSSSSEDEGWDRFRPQLNKMVTRLQLQQQQNPLPSNPPQQPESSDSERSAGEESEGDEAESEESSDEGSGNNSSSD
jgi:hypothetical protein